MSDENRHGPPEGWSLPALDVVAQINPSAPRGLDDGLLVSFAPMTAVQDSSPSFAFLQDRPIGRVRKGYTPFAENDVLFAKITPCMENGKAAIARGLTNGLGFGTTELFVLRASQALLPEYLYRFMHQESVRRDAAANFSGSAGQLRVPKSFVSELPIPLPPLAEQRRIVAKVESLLARVQAVRQRLARTSFFAKRFRRATLRAASNGQLTASWREKKTGSDSLVGWTATTIGGAAECLDSRRRPVNRTERAERNGEIPYYGANGQVGWIDTHLFDEPLVLVVEDESFVGRTKPFSYVIRGKSWVNNHAHVLRPQSQVSVDYLNACLSYYDFVPLTSGTTGRRKLTKAALLSAPLELPPLDEQLEIVRRVCALFALADAIERRAAAASARADRMTQAILAKAFRGELVPTEAELARAEGRDYETAEQLLERIRSEQGDAPRRKQAKQSRKTASS